MAKKDDDEASKEVAVKQEAGVPAKFDYGDRAGAGFEGTQGKDLSVPFITILQSNSPQVEDESPPEARPGMIFDTVTKELRAADVGLVFQPVYKEHAWVEWIPRAKGGGFVAMHDPEEEFLKDLENILNDEGDKTSKLRYGDNELVETFYVYGLILDDEGADTTGFAVISFTSTKIKSYKDWYTSMYTLKNRPPIYANRARIRTLKKTNKHGTFHIFDITPLRGGNWENSLIDPETEEHLLVGAVEFETMVKSGMARADFNSEKSSDGEGSPAGVGGGDDGDGEAPF